MIKIKGSPSHAVTFRFTTFMFASLVGGLAAWELSADLLRPTVIEFPTDRQLAVSMYSQRNAIVTAAEIGLIRGDLWADAAFAYGNMLWIEDEQLTDANRVSVERTRALTERAITWAAHDARLWLLLAATHFRVESSNDSLPTAPNQLSAALKMCYYTGLNNVELIQARLFFALQSDLLQDDEFRELVRHDIKVAATRKTEFTPILVEVYKSVPQTGKQFIAKALSEFDPGMLESIRPASQNN